jgi:hypothetical protein
MIRVQEKIFTAETLRTPRRDCFFVPEKSREKEKAL